MPPACVPQGRTATRRTAKCTFGRQYQETTERIFDLSEKLRRGSTCRKPLLPGSPRARALHFGQRRHHFKFQVHLSRPWCSFLAFRMYVRDRAIALRSYISVAISYSLFHLRSQAQQANSLERRNYSALYGARHKQPEIVAYTVSQCICVLKLSPCYTTLRVCYFISVLYSE